MVRIRIFPHALELLASGPVRLVDLVDEREGDGVGLRLSCRGGNCGVCRVHVKSGAELLELASSRERETLSLAHAAPDERLGCQLSVRERAQGVVELVLSSADVPAGS